MRYETKSVFRTAKFRGETSDSANRVRLPSCQNIHTDAINWFGSFFLSRLQIIPQSPASESSCFIPVSRFHLPHPRRRSGTRSIRQPGEAERERKILSVPSTRAENVVGHVFLQLWFPVCINKVLTLALLKVSSCYKLPKLSLSLSFTLLLSGFLALVLPFPWFLSNSAPPLFSSSLSLIHTGSRVIDVAAEVRTTASITFGISSPVTRGWHRRCFCSCRFTVSRPSAGEQAHWSEIFTSIHSHESVNEV